MIKVGVKVKHVSGWVGTVEKIEGEMLGNRVIYVNGDRWLECVLTPVEESQGEA